MPNCAEEIVAPVVGDTNLFIQSCCIIRPATLMPTPVQRIASNRGNLEIRKISICSTSPLSRLAGLTSKTPTKSDQTDKMTSRTARTMVKPYFLIVVASSHKLVQANCGKYIIILVCNMQLKKRILEVLDIFTIIFLLFYTFTPIYISVFLCYSLTTYLGAMRRSSISNSRKFLAGSLYAC